MDTASPQFIAFGLFAAFLSNLSRSLAWRNGVLLISSFVFIGLLVRNASFGVLAPFFGFLALGYGGIKIVASGRPKMLAASVLTVIVAYLWLKKYTFLPERTFLSFPYFTLGLSYIFFRVLSLLVASADGTERPPIGPIRYLIYVLNFTTLVSGPIQTYDSFARDQFSAEPIELTPAVIGIQIERIIRGFFKVNVLAMILLALQQDALRELSSPLLATQHAFPVFRLIILYPLFLYANFSGYIDIVIALARLLRIRPPENFNRPFSAASFLEFWNRWHMTLSQWLKTHVYNPLLIALMRRTPSVSLEPMIGVFCFFVTFFLVGIWHGRTSEFAVFGLLQGGGVALNKLWQMGIAGAVGRKKYREISQNAAYVAFGRGLTFSYFAFTLFWFWASWQQIALIAKAIAGPLWLGVGLTVWVCASVVATLWERLRAVLLSIKLGDASLFGGRYAMVVYASLLGLAALLVTVVLDQPAPDVVYKAF
jgi:D-alanyl-lipoteichoic acid acyltransferase DltB (MBOAT superfamily)